jgi:predicted PurR-regulated permease PerM
MDPDPRAGLRRVEPIVVDMVIRLGIVGLLFWLSLQMILPFASLLMWSAILAVALFPVHAWIQRRLGGRSIAAAIVMMVLCFAAIIVPSAALMASLVETLTGLVAALRSNGLTLTPPDWVAKLPVFGAQISEAWRDVAGNLDGLAEEFGPVLVDAGGWLLGLLGSFAGAALFFALAVLLSGVLMVVGPRMVGWLRMFADRVLGPRGEDFVRISGATIRNVARGVIGVALIQSLLTGVGFMIAGVPGAGLITLAALVLSIVQIGAWPVVYPMLIWVWLNMDFWPALLLTIYMLPVGAIDNILKPLVMSQGLNTPMLVILLGVIGGTFAYGMVGLFLGPVILALFWELLSAWIKAPGADEAAATNDH